MDTHVEVVRSELPWQLVVESPDLIPYAWLAASDWQSHIPCEVSFDVVLDTVEPTIRTIVIQKVDVMPPEATSDAIGWTWCDPYCRISVLPPGGRGDDPGDFVRVMKHEIGHGMGLPHNDSGDGVMMTAGYVRNVSELDGQAYASRHCH